MLLFLCMGHDSIILKQRERKVGVHNAFAVNGHQSGGPEMKVYSQGAMETYFGIPGGET